MSLEELIKAAHQLNETDLDQLLHQVVVLRASRKAPVLPEVESQLIQQINQGIPSDLDSQYRSLQQKRDTTTLTETEHQTLTQLSEQVEQIGAQRLEALANLAQLRQTPLLDLMETLGIQPVTYV
jgi:uncharacterized phage-associated protein